MITRFLEAIPLQARLAIPETSHKILLSGCDDYDHDAVNDRNNLA